MFISSTPPNPPNQPVQKRGDGESIDRSQRGLLWYLGQPYPRFSHAVHNHGCKLSSVDLLKTISVALRVCSDEKGTAFYFSLILLCCAVPTSVLGSDPNALLYNRRKNNVPGYFKLIQGRHYYLNLTFAMGSTVAQHVGQQQWRPIMFLALNRPERPERTFVDIKSSAFRHFANFVTNW